MLHAACPKTVATVAAVKAYSRYCVQATGSAAGATLEEFGAMSNPENEARERVRRKIQEQLDEALADSSPASDPVSIVTSGDEEDWGAEPGAATPEAQPGAPKP
jgi:hypothetical protein